MMTRHYAFPCHSLSARFNYRNARPNIWHVPFTSRLFGFSAPRSVSSSVQFAVAFTRESPWSFNNGRRFCPHARCIIDRTKLRGQYPPARRSLFLLYRAVKRNFSCDEWCRACSAKSHRRWWLFNNLLRQKDILRSDPRDFLSIPRELATKETALPDPRVDIVHRHIDLRYVRTYRS